MAKSIITEPVFIHKNNPARGIYSMGHPKSATGRALNLYYGSDAGISGITESTGHAYKSVSMETCSRPKASANALKVISPLIALAPSLISSLSCMAFFQPLLAISTA